MNNCKQKFIDYLQFIPQTWREQIADVLCTYVVNGSINIDCDKVIECQTLTSLSDFTVTGTIVSITFVDEHGVSVTRTFDFNDILNHELDSVDPGCLSSVQEWNNMTYVQKWQAIIDKVCETCP